MTLIERIKEDQLKARKERVAPLATLLTTLIGEAEAEGKKSNRAPTDEETTKVIQKFLKGAQEMQSLTLDEVCAQNVEFEITNLKHYLPVQLTREQIINHLASAAFHDGLVENKGVMMKYLKDHFAGQYEGKLASQIIDEILAK